MDEEMITITMKELRRKNSALWTFVHGHFPFAQGDLDRYLDLAVEKEQYEQHGGPI